MISSESYFFLLRITFGWRYSNRPTVSIHGIMVSLVQRCLREGGGKSSGWATSGLLNEGLRQGDEGIMRVG